MRALLLSGVALAAAWAALPGSAGAVSTGNLSGSVVDCRSSARLPHAQVLFRDARSGAVERRSVADSKGHVTALGLPEGRYLVQIIATGRNGLHLITVDPGDVENYRLGAATNGDCRPFELSHPPETTDKTTIR